MRRTLFAAGMLLAGWTGTANAAPVTMDFDSLPVSPTTAVITFGGVIEEDGFRLTTSTAFGGFGSFNNPSSPFYTGSTAIFSNLGGGVTTLTQINGNPFTMSAINLAFRGPRIVGQATSLTFTGLTTTGTVSQTFNYNQETVVPISSENFFFGAGFTDLLSVSWVQGSEGHQFDNIVVDGSPSVDVAAPATLGLFGAALLGFGVARRRRRT